MARIPGTPYAIAAGFACGAAVSFTPFIGLHFLLGALLAWLIGANILTSAMGTVVGNPWTFPFIWVIIYHVGSWLLGMPITDDLLQQMTQTLGQHTMIEIIRSPLATLGPFFQSIVLPMFVGGLLIGAIVWVIVYLVVEKIVREYKHKKNLRRKAASQKRAAFKEGSPRDV